MEVIFFSEFGQITGEGLDFFLRMERGGWALINN